MGEWNWLGFGGNAGWFCLRAAAGARYETSRYTRTKSGDGWSWKRAALEGEHAKNIQFFEVSEDGKTIVYFYSTASKLPQIYRAQLDGTTIVSPVQMTKLNEGLVKNRTFARTEVIRWKGANDEEVEGILYYPDNYEAGKKYPVITAIHGGPTGHDGDLWEDNWAYPINLLTHRGAFILRPNYHGSNNYGLKWVESICCGKYYDLETPDINAGVDYLIAQRNWLTRIASHAGLVEWFDLVDQFDYDVSGTLQSCQRWRRRCGVDQRLGQCSVWRFLRFVLFRKIADGRSRTVYSQVAILQVS